MLHEAISTEGHTAKRMERRCFAAWTFETSFSEHMPLDKVDVMG